MTGQRSEIVSVALAVLAAAAFAPLKMRVQRVVDRRLEVGSSAQLTTSATTE